MQPGQPAGDVPVPAASEPLSLGRGEVIMTAEQAKTAKVQKGFVLAPVGALPQAAEPVPLSAKRERKKSNHFGHSPEPEGSVMPSPRTYKPKAARAPSFSNGSPMPEAAVASGAPTPWSDRKRILQDRLKRINAQLRKLGPPSHLALVPPASPAHVPMMAFRGVSPAPLTPIPETWAHTPTGNGDGGMLGERSNKRKASLERSISANKLADLGLGAKKPRSGKGKKGDRLVPYGKLRNIYFHCEKLLESLMKDALAKLYFNVPVDPIALGIPHYTQIITDPMDLGTVRRRLENEYYDDVPQFHADLNLIWDNATHFNPPGTDVHESAKVLKESTDKRIKKLPKLPGAPKDLDMTGDNGGEAGQRKLADIMRKMEKMQSDLQTMKQSGGGGGERRASGGGAASAGPKKKPAAGAPAKKAMTFEEKRQLSLNINKLDEDKLGKVVEIIKKRKSNIMGKDNDEIEIDIDSLDNATLRELEKYVDECLRPQPQKVSKQALASSVRQALGGVAANAGSPASSSDSDSDSDSDGGDLRGAAWGDMGD